MAKREPIVKVDWTGKLQVYSFSDYLPMRALAHRVKDGDKEGIDKAAKIMAGLVMTVPDYKDGILVPMPGRNGKAGYTKALADEIASLLGLEVQDVLTVKPHKSLYEKKAKNGIDGLRPFKFVATGQIPKEKQPILIDNVLDTGTTAMSAFKTLGDKTSLVVLGSTVNYRRYNYPISIHMEDHKADRRTADDLRKELVTTISDALYFNGFNKRDINAWKQQPFKHEKTLSGMLNHPVLISTFDKPIVRIGYDHESWGRLGECLYSSDGEQLFADRLNNVQDMDALLHELHNTYFNQRGNVLSTLGRHAFKVGEAIQLNNLDYRVMEIGTFHSLLKPFGASGVKLMDDAGKTQILMAETHASTKIYVQPESKRMIDTMHEVFGYDIRPQIKEALDVAIGQSSVKGDRLAEPEIEKESNDLILKDTIMSKKKNETEVKEAQQRQEAAKKQEAQKAEAQRRQEQQKHEAENRAAKKEPKPKIAGAVAQALLLTAVLSQAKENGGVWLNKNQKKAPGIFGEATQLTPYNNLLMSAHSDQHDYKTSQYTSFEKAKTQGIPVQQGEEGVPLSWTKWDIYVNKYDRTDVKSHDDYLQVPEEERSNYRAVPKKEYRYMFNVEQTVMPFKDEAKLNKLIDTLGSAKGNTAVLKPISEESVIAQTYTNLKQKHPDAVLLFRKGDFYNTYNDDAKVSADKLGITLTTPTKLKGIDRLASFPHQQLDIYLPKLVRAGLRVAIVDEPMENQVKSTQVHDSKQEREAEDRMAALTKQLNDRLVSIKPISSLEKTHYDAEKDVVFIAPRESYDSYTDYAHDIAVALVASTGSQQRLDRGDRSASQLDNAEKYEDLVRELSAGTVMAGLGLQARLSAQSLENVDYWIRELREDPKLINRLERDINSSLEVIDKISRDVAIDYAKYRDDRPKQVETPMNYSISRELNKYPSIESKEFVVIRDKADKSAAVILPAGASMKVNNEIPGMNKSRIAAALKKEGVDGEKITFHNAGGALGLHEANAYYDGKDVTVNRLKQYTLIPVTRLDVSSLVQQKAELEKFNLFQDNDNNYALFIKPKGENAITMYPSKEDITLFFNSLKDAKGAAIRGDLGQKYYMLAQEHPELKKDLLSIDTGDIDLSRISKVNLFKSDSKSSAILMSATIDGQKQQAREVSKADWNRFWLVDDQNQFKLQLATKVFDNVLRETKKEEAEPEVQQTKQFHR